ncbi:hypothetical protein ACIQZB_07640 [Streptomyces sp. NPDC097727]|uniref:hypothetical protein n=1 Tax=Streptomyces sp. NPDC097727 TaxID=3366092 RepID=UPI003830B016
MTWHTGGEADSPETAVTATTAFDRGAGVQGTRGDAVRDSTLLTGAHGVLIRHPRLVPPGGASEPDVDVFYGWNSSPEVFVEALRVTGTADPS